MNILFLVLNVCILANGTLGRKKRSPESDYWVEYQPLPSKHGNVDTRSEVNTINPQGNQNNYSVIYKDTGYSNDAYPLPAKVQQVQQAVQQAVQEVTNVVPTTGFTNQTVHQICHRALDIGIMLDSSYTMEGNSWQEEKRTVQSLIDKLDISKNGVHVAVMSFSTDVELAIPFNGYKDVQELKQKIENIDYMDGWSRTDLALDAAKHQLFSNAGGSRTGIPKALIVLSDGRTDGESLPDRSINWTERIIPVVQDLKKDGINILCIGTDNADTTELNVIASDKNNVFRAADLDKLTSKLEAISSQQCYSENNTTNPPQCVPGCFFPAICLLAVQPTCLPINQQTVTCTIPGSCTSTAITTATSTAVLTTTSTEIQRSTEVTTLSTVEKRLQTAIETSTYTTTATDTLTETAVSTSTDFHTITKTDTATQTHHVTETSTETATSTKVHKTTETLSTTDIDTITSTHVATETQTAIATSTAIATKFVTSTLLTTSLDIDTSTHITTATLTALETSTKTHVTTATDTSTAVTTATKMKTLTTTSTALTTSTRLKTDVSTKVLTDTRTLTTTKTHHKSLTHVTTSTGFTTSTLLATLTKTETDTAIVTSTAVAVSTKVLTTTSTDLATSTHVTTATRTKVHTSTATDTKTLTTVSTDISTSTHVTTQTNTAVVSVTDTHTKVTTLTSTETETDTKTLTTVSTDVSTSTQVATKTSTAVATETSTAVVSVTDTQTDFTTVTSTAVDTSTSTSTQVTTATITATKTRTAVSTSTAVTTATDTSTETEILTTVETSTEKLTQTATKTATVMSTSIVTSCSFNCPSASPTPSLTSTPLPLTSSATPTPPVPTTKVTTKQVVKCKTTVDLGFLIDGSSSIETSGIGNFERCKDFVKKMVSYFDISESGTHIGVVQFANKVYVHFAFNDYFDKESINIAIDDISMLYGGTKLGKGLTKVKTGLFDTGSRLSVPRIVIVMTDGSAEDLIDEPAKALRDDGVNIFCLGIGNKVRIKELNIIATDPDSDHVFKSGFNELSSVVELIEEKACPAPTPSVTPTTLPRTSSVTPTPPVPTPQVPGCKEELDVGVIIDASNNMQDQSYTSLKNFVAQLAGNFVVSKNGAHFGVLSYDEETRLDFRFSDSKFQNPDKLQDKIRGLERLGSGSRIDLAIEKATQDLFSSSGGYRLDKPKALIVFTEDRTSAGSKPYSQVIAPLIGKNVRIIVVGITDKVDGSELKEIANGDVSNVFMVNQFDDLSSIMKDLNRRICNSPPPPPTEPTKTSTCTVGYKKLGCYKEDPSFPSMPERVLSVTPNWSDFASWLQSFVCQCAEKANTKQYTVFGVRDSGECVSGPEAADMYEEYGGSTNCVDGHFDLCKNDNKKECCGEKNTNYVYGIIIESKTTPTPITTPTPKPEVPCKAVVDLVFVMDGSGSIEHFGIGNFDRCKKFAKDMAKSFEISESGTHVSVVLFSTSASVMFRLDEHYDIASIDKAIDDILYPKGETYIGTALSLTKSGVTDVSGRSDVYRIVLVMTDGISMDDASGPAQALKDAGNSLYMLGIGSSFDISQLNTLASDPDKDYVFTSGFEDLDEAEKKIKDKACTEASKPLPTPVVVVTNAKFIREPPSIVYVRIGTTVRFVWEYQVSNRNTAFARYSPIWYYYYSNGASVELSSEDKNIGWLWSVSSTCPASYRERISKEEQATLVITSVTIADGGFYGCSLMMASGQPILSKVQLVSLDARFTRTPAQVVYAYVGDTVRLQWLYAIDGGRDNAFGRYSPTWDLYYSDDNYAELASDDKNNGWRWSISASCPATLKGRLTKESDATLVISMVTAADSGTYGCRLVMVSGLPVISKVQLVVREKPKPTEEVFVVDFTKVPPREVYAYAGATVKLEWEYATTGDKNIGFARFSPTWNLYNENGEGTELASEDKMSSWKWMISSTCPASLEGKLKKEMSANLIISNIAVADSGTYGCTLDLAFGDPLTDKVKLIVTEPSIPEVVTPPCEAVVDLVFLIDGSTSIEQFGMGNFKRCLNFAKTMVRNFKVSKEGTHVGVVLFTNKAKVVFTLTEYYEQAEIEGAIDKIQYPQGSTFAGEGLKAVREDVFEATGRPQIPHALIIMTDGQSIDDIETPSTALKEDGTLIYCLGIGSEYNMQQLNTMASTPPLGHVYVADFDKLDTVVESIKQKACTDAGSVVPTPDPSTGPPTTVNPDVKCKTTVDLGFLIDGSSSIETSGIGNFDRCKDFVKKMISNFDISESGTHVGVVQFANKVYVNFTFNEYFDKASINKAIDDIPMLYGGTNLGKGLTKVKTGLFDAGSRLSVPRILIVMTDGRAEDLIDEPAKALRDEGVTIFCLGIGNKVMNKDLNIIATDPDSDHVFKSGFNDLSSVVELIEQKACPDSNSGYSSSSSQMSAGGSSSSSHMSAGGSSSSSQMSAGGSSSSSHMSAGGSSSSSHMSAGGSSSSSYSYSYSYCSVRYRKLGCYGDDQQNPRPLAAQIFTDQNPDSELFSGITMDLGKWDSYMSDVVCRCAKNAESREFKLFGIQNFGECWSGSDAEQTYNRNGESQSCISTQMETCDAENKVACVGNKTSNFVYEIDVSNGMQAEACSVSYEKVGCFKDEQTSPRPFSELVTTDLDPKSELYSGSPINKGDWDTYLGDVVCRCAQNIREYEYEYFGIQKLGECWSGPSAKSTYNSDGQSDTCVSKEMKTCVDDSLDNCVGQEKNNYVYRIIKTNTQNFKEF